MPRNNTPSEVPGRRGAAPESGAKSGAVLALAMNGMGSFDWNQADGKLSYDRSCLDVLGFLPGEFDGRLETAVDRVLPADRAAVRKQVLRGLRERSSFNLYFRVQFAHTGFRWAHVQGRVVP